LKKVLLLLCLMPWTLFAATLTNVSMQGTMVMPMIAYNAGLSQLQVMLDTNVPQLTPLLISNPADSFDPGDPWFSNLDPGAQGYSFSRRYGFVMDMMSDPLPVGTQIWIRKLSGPPELGFYRYSASAPKAWEPIFGTAGSPSNRYWNGMMFHPGVSAPSGSQGYVASFEAYLVDTGSGLEVPDSGTGPFNFTFTNLDDGRPPLGLGTVFAMTWPTNATNWVVESAGSITATNWTAVTNVPVIVDGQSAVLLPPAGGGQYYRLRRQP